VFCRAVIVNNTSLLHIKRVTRILIGIQCSWIDQIARYTGLICALWFTNINQYSIIGLWTQKVMSRLYRTVTLTGRLIVHAIRPAARTACTPGVTV